jgi:hypothetical protein
MYFEALYSLFGGKKNSLFKCCASFEQEDDVSNKSCMASHIDD